MLRRRTPGLPGFSTAVLKTQGLKWISERVQGDFGHLDSELFQPASDLLGAGLPLDNILCVCRRDTWKQAVELWQTVAPNLGFRSPSFRVHLGHGYFKDHWLPFRDQKSLTARQRGNEQQFHSLHCRFNPPQRMTAQRDFMRSEDQTQSLFLAIAL